MTDRIKTFGDKTLNEVLENPRASLAAALFAITMKYGMAPLCCIFLGYVCLKQNDTIKSQNTEQVKAAEAYAERSIAVIKSNTEAVSKSSEIQSNLVRLLEDRERRPLSDR